MNIQSHKRTLGVIHIVYGCMIAISFLFIGGVVNALFPFIAEEIAKDASSKNADEILLLVSGIIRSIFILLLIFSALPSIIAGVGLVSNKNWGLVMGLIAGCISIFGFPFGTAVGIYSIYVFVINNRQKHEQNQG